MLLLVARHSLAQEPSSAGSDDLRALTAAGIERAKRLGQRLVKERLVPQQVYCSSLVRAAETAKLVSTECGLPEPEQRQELYPDHDLFASLKALCDPAQAAHSCIMLIGHQPHVGQLVNTLLPRGPRELRISPATAVIIELTEWRRGAGTLRLYLSGEEL